MSNSSPRQASVHRQTGETDIRLSLILDGTGTSDVQTGIGFLDHMLTLFARHAVMDLVVHAAGDLHVDGHHTAEDVGLVLGEAILQAVADKAGLTRYGNAFVPMDECLARCVLDLSGRPLAMVHAAFTHPTVGTLATELVPEFFKSVAATGKLTLHLDLLRGGNDHHGIEAMFKAFGRALRMATTADPRVVGVPSTKGVL